MSITRPSSLHNFGTANYTLSVAISGSSLVTTRLCFDTVSDRVGFGLMDAKKMVDLAINWTTVPPKVNCTILRHGVNR